MKRFSRKPLSSFVLASFAVLAFMSICAAQPGGGYDLFRSINPGGSGKSSYSPYAKERSIGQYADSTESGTSCSLISGLPEGCISPTPTRTKTPTETRTSTPTQTATSTPTITSTQTPTSTSVVFHKLAPANVSYASTNPALSWSAIEGASKYEYCIDASDNGGCDTSWVSTGSSTSANLSGLGNNDTYYWQVRAANDGGIVEADGSAWWSFTARHQTFADVPIDHELWEYIEAFYNAGITGGCGISPLIYCPEQPVTRAAMAVFLLRAKYGASYTPPAASHFFADLPVAGKEWQEAWVDQLYREGITSGCGTSPLTFCPEQPITRAAMTVFILRGKYGSSYSPPPASHYFSDMPVAGKEWMEPWVDELYREGITSGCGTAPLTYCPETAVKRQSMAAFIVRAFSFPLP